MNILKTTGSLDASTLSDGFDPPHLKDERFVSLSRTPLQPCNAIDQNGAQFKLNRISDIYLMDNITIELSVRLVTKDLPHSTPLPGAWVAPVNNVLHSCISEVKIYVNGISGRCR